MKDVHFGFGMDFSSGETPSVGLNRRGNVVLVYEAPNGRKRYRVGRLSQATIEWKRSKPADAGVTPRVALNNNNIAVEVHRNPDHKTLYCRVGRLGGARDDEVTWPNARRYAGQGGNRTGPVVALNDAGVVVEVHEVHEGRGIWPDYGVGQVKEAGGELYVEWSGKRVRGHPGDMPGIAINNHGMVVKVYRSGSKNLLYYTVGRVEGRTIDFQTPKQIKMPNGVEANGHYPSVALTDDGLVIVALRARTKVEVLELIGEVSADGKSITWKRWWFYDKGTRPSVAAAGTMAVEIHQHGDRAELLFSTSIITDRASWMQNRLDTLGHKPLRDLVLPASHDAGMYKGNVISALGRTQTRTIYEQLRYGIRYFDLRPWWIVAAPHWVIEHGGIIGPSVQTVLNDVRQFAEEGHQELVILKISHFRNTNPGRYSTLRRMIEATIGSWLVKSLPGNQRLADVTLNEYVARRKGPAILVVVDGQWAVNERIPGLWVYRDWSSPRPKEGELRVFDQYSQRERLNEMRRIQVEKFADYDGTMENDPNEPCDLFLLSWTLTPKKRPPWLVWPLAREVNPHLGHFIRFDRTLENPNEHGKIINLLYVDYVEFARVTDVALFQNGERTAADDEAKPRKRAKVPM